MIAVVRDQLVESVFLVVLQEEVPEMLMSSFVGAIFKNKNIN